MAFWIGITSMGLSIDLHYCSGELKSVAVIGKAKNCHELAKKAHCKHHHSAQIIEKSCDGDKKNCCSNESLYLQNDQDLFQNSQKAEHSQTDTEKYDSQILSVSLFNHSETFDPETVITKPDPPPVTIDRVIRFQNFRL
ncbi:MAG: hypothetical protein R3275_01205 [Saprospiraceae bacterium]|nr:hypothetical protein [Saprospiraceae bacterium]